MILFSPCRSLEVNCVFCPPAQKTLESIFVGWREALGILMSIRPLSLCLLPHLLHVRMLSEADLCVSSFFPQTFRPNTKCKSSSDLSLSFRCPPSILEVTKLQYFQPVGRSVLEIRSGSCFVHKPLMSNHE